MKRTLPIVLAFAVISLAHAPGSSAEERSTKVDAPLAGAVQRMDRAAIRQLIEKRAEILAPAAERSVGAERGIAGDPEGGEVVGGDGFLRRVAVGDDGTLVLRLGGKKDERGKTEQDEGFHGTI